jgi:hypothetical protein
VNGSGDYALRVRARPYGPREVTAGGVTAWFHGPFAVLTFTGAGGAVTIRADVADLPAGRAAGSSLGDDLVTLFDSAGRGLAAELPGPQRLVCERPLPASGAHQEETRVLGLTVRSAPQGALVTVALTDRTVGVELAGRDGEVLAAEIRSWASAPGPEA